MSRTEDGFALLEVMVAAMVLVIGILGMVLGMAASQKLSLVSDRQSSMENVAQREIERLEGIPYAQLGLSATPGTSADSLNPDYYVAAGPPTTFEWNRTVGSTESLDVDTVNGAVPPTTSWTEGGFSGTLYDFITWTSDPKCSPGCPSTQDYKRLTVGVTLTGDQNPSPVFLSSVVADPNAAPAGGTVNGTDGNPIVNPATTCENTSGVQVQCESPIDSGNPSTFYLHDCAATNSSCSAPSGNSVTQQTVGVATGLVCTTLTTLGGLLADITGCPMPDLMDANPPSGTSSTPLYQYSTDQGTAGYPGGRLLQPTCSTSGSGCGTGSTSDCSGGGIFNSSLLSVQSQFWVSSPVTAQETLTGDGGISMFTQTQNSISAVVSFCIEIYDIPPSNGVAGSLGDLLAWPPVALGGVGYVAATDPSTSANWPAKASQVSYTFNFRGSSGSVSIAAGHRIGVRVWMKANVSSAIALVYDNPLYPSEIQLNTQ